MNIYFHPNEFTYHAGILSSTFNIDDPLLQQILLLGSTGRLDQWITMTNQQIQIEVEQFRDDIKNNISKCVYHPQTNGCWVDSFQFRSYHDHHVFPQAYGGVDGPRVYLCHQCHDGLHHAAIKNMNALQYASDEKCKYDIIKDIEQGVVNILRMQLLIGIIVNSKQATINSPNRKIKKVTTTNNML